MEIRFLGRPFLEILNIFKLGVGSVHTNKITIKPIFQKIRKNAVVMFTRYKTLVLSTFMDTNTFFCFSKAFVQRQDEMVFEMRKYLYNG